MQLSRVIICCVEGHRSIGNNIVGPPRLSEISLSSIFSLCLHASNQLAMLMEGVRLAFYQIED